jgi:general secretion pathway protein A
MYEQFYGLKEKPFSLLPDPSFLYMTRAHSMALTMLEYSLNNDSAGICVISGEIGSGKTTLIRKLLDIMGTEFTTGLLTNTHIEFGNLLQWISMTFGLDYINKEPVELYENFVNFMIAQYAKGKRTVLIIDEAQNLSYKALEELRMLSNINADKDNVLQLILVGQPQLRKTFNIEKLEQLNQRVTVSYHLKELSRKDSCAYIKHRLKTAGGDPELISDLARKAIWYHSRGIPRVINTLCDTALVYGFAVEKQQVDIQLVNEVIKDRKDNGYYISKNDIPANITRLDDNRKNIINLQGNV